jgi:hypothetical protein
MLDAFPDLYARVRSILESHFNAKVDYADHLALPGFHVFRSNRLRTLRDIPPHFDCQFSLLPPLASANSTDSFSFTHPIALPKGGGGLEYWEVFVDECQSDMARGTIRCSTDYVHMRELKYLGYEIGTLVLQPKLLLHRIASTSTVADEDERVTLQGHGIKSDGRYLLYW